MSLADKVCLVTGASRGIGRATALALVAQGAGVAAAASSTAALADLGVASTHAADLSDPGEALALAEEVLAAHGRVDVLVLNAGLRVDGRVDGLTLDDVDRSFQVNVLSPFALAGALLPGMREREHGVIATMLAPKVAGGRKGMGAYAASKAALASLTQTLRQEAGAKVAVFGFDPGWVRTDLAPDGPEEPAAAAERLVAHLAAGKGAREPLS
jgi:NAD(P)-dependent dehydrogenase (short-subunit alcohol dehydrogenase family)